MDEDEDEVDGVEVDDVMVGSAGEAHAEITAAAATDATRGPRRICTVASSRRNFAPRLRSSPHLSGRIDPSITVALDELEQSRIV